MKKELSDLKEKRMLYESSDPLFPDLILRKKRRISRICMGLFLIILIISVCAFAVAGKTGDADSGTSFETGVDNEEVPSVPPEESEGEMTEAPNTEEESDTTSDDTQDGDATAEDIGDDETQADVMVIEEVDLSEAEKGEDYIISYTDRSIDVRGLLERGFVDLSNVGEAPPIVLIIHTHTSEQYIANDSAIPGFNGVVTAGDILNQRLNSLGVSSVHCTVIHDNDDNNAYLNARETLNTMLRIYPSVKLVIDLHRLELQMSGAVVKTVSGCQDRSAQIRLTVSTGLDDKWQEDLSLALSLRKSLNTNGERVCMPVVVSTSRYNSDLCEYYIMADIGASGNEIGEAKAAAERLAEAISDVMLKK